MKSHAFLITFIGLIFLSACSPSDESSYSQEDTEPQSNTAEVELVSEEDQNSSPKPSGTSEDSITSPLEITNAGQVFDPNLAQQLNSLGFDYYQEKDYGQAAENFAQAMAYDDTNPLPVYNLACTLALMDSPEAPADPQEIVGHLWTTLQLAPERLAKIKSDSDLDSIRGSAPYQSLMAFFDAPYAEVFLKAFRPDSLLYSEWFMYRQECTVLVSNNAGVLTYVPMHMISYTALDSDRFVLLYPVYVVQEGSLEPFQDMKGEHPGVFGYIYGIEDCQIHVAYADREGKLLGQGFTTGYDATMHTPFFPPVGLGGWAFSYDYAFFVSGRIIQRHFVNWSQGKVWAAEPIVVNSEDLSGGEAPLVSYENFQIAGNTLRVDRLVNGQWEKTENFAFRDISYTQ
jgi:tetratricopeptide (TPR) repeat protein